MRKRRPRVMLKQFLCAIAILTIAMAGSVSAQEPVTSPSIKPLGTDCDIVLAGRRVAPELWRLGLLTVADLQPLAAYCSSCATWATAERALRVSEDERERKILQRIARDSCRAMVRFAAQFGMTPRSRAAVGP